MDPEILTRRAEIARAIDGQTLCGLLELTARDSPCRPALSEPVPARDVMACSTGGSGSRPAAARPGRPGGTEWQTLTWPQAREQVLRLAASFEALGLAPGERVALMLPNRTEHWLADQAAVHAAGCR